MPNGKPPEIRSRQEFGDGMLIPRRSGRTRRGGRALSTLSGSARMEFYQSAHSSQWALTSAQRPRRVRRRGHPVMLSIVMTWCRAADRGCPAVCPAL